MANLTDNASDPPNLLDNATPVSTATTKSTSSGGISNAILNPFDPRLPLPDSEHDPLYLMTPQTWAKKNPGFNVQKEHPRAKPTATAKATKK